MRYVVGSVALMAVLFAAGFLVAGHGNKKPVLSPTVLAPALTTRHVGPLQIHGPALDTMVSTVQVAKAAAAFKTGFVTFGWAVPADTAGFRLYKDGVLVSTAGPAATSTRFSVTAGSHTLEVRAVLSSTPPQPTTTTATTTTTPTTTTTQQPAGFWSDPIPANPAIDSNSSAAVTLIQQAANSQGFLIAAQKWSVPVFHTSGGTKKPVALTASWAPVHTFTGVPFPAGAAPSPDSDGHMAIIDDLSGCEYDFYKAVHNTDGSWSAGWMNATLTSGTGWFPWSATGSGDALTAGLITPAEMAAGHIGHALKFAYPYTKTGGPVLPAVASDGTHTDAGALPEGARLQLDPNLDLSTLALTGWQLTVAKALQTYGMYLSDTGGGVALPAQESAQGQTYPWGTGDYAYLPTPVLAHLRLLKLGAQYTPVTPDPASPCGVFS